MVVDVRAGARAGHQPYVRGEDRLSGGPDAGRAFGILEETEWRLDIEEYGRDHILKESVTPEFAEIDFDELMEKKVVRANFPENYVAFESMRFATPSGKIELYTEDLTEFGEELACHYEPLEGNRSPAAATYPLTFMNCRTVYTTHSQHVQLPWIREVAPEPRLEMAPADAEARGIATGDVVEVFNDRGSYKVKALVTPEIKPGCLNQRQGWWPKDFPENTHYSALIQMTLKSGARRHIRDELRALRQPRRSEKGLGDVP